jgi:AcrR family transcriptional regulator
VYVPYSTDVDRTTAEDVPQVTPGRGKPRDQAKRAAVVAAALEILAADGLAALTMERIAARAGVSKVTLYRWWDHRAAIALEGLLAELQPALAWPDSGDFPADLRRQVDTLARALTGPRGPVFAAVIAAAQEDEGVRRAFVEQFIGPRRAEAHAAFARARERGQIRRDVDLDAAIDVVYGPLYYRLLLRHQPLTPATARRIADHALAGLVPSGPGEDRGAH